MKVLIAGGGTGGHIYPALAIANQIKYLHSDWEVEYAGRVDCMEGDIVPKAGYEIHNIRIYGFERYYSTLKKISVFFKMFKGYSDAKRVVKKFCPDIVIGTGGFVSGPVVLAGVRKKKKSLIHEQNAIPGFTTKMLSKWADTVCATFKNTKEFVEHPGRVVYTGNPVRREFDLYTKEIARKTLQIDMDKKIILSFGGSLGAKNLNLAMMYLIEKLQDNDNVYIYHVTGKNQYDDFCKGCEEKGLNLDKINNVEILDYIYDMPLYMNASDIVISRSGATSIAEITYMGLAGIYIPYPHAANDHQTKNAMEVVKGGGGYMIEDDKLDGDSLFEKVNTLLTDEEIFNEVCRASKELSMKDSADLIVKEIEKLIM